MTEMQMNAEQKAAAVLKQLGAEGGWVGTSGVVSVYFTRDPITDADLQRLEGLPNFKKLKLRKQIRSPMLIDSHPRSDGTW